MPDRDHIEERDRRLRSQREDRDQGRTGEDAESRTWSSEDGRDARGRGGDTPYVKPHTGSQTASEAGWSGGGYGDQGGFGSQHGQGGYASPAQGSRYGQTGSEWGRSGYGSEGGRREPGRYGGGEAAGFGSTSYAAERDSHEHRSGGAQRDYGFRGQGGGGAQWGGREGYGEGGYGQGYAQGASGTCGQEDYGRSARRSQYRTDQNAGAFAGRGGGFAGDPRGQSGASGQGDDHEPHYRRWRDQQLDNHDRDYDRWRAAQSERYDDEYRTYRDQRHDSFTRDFGSWRDKDRAEAGGTARADLATTGAESWGATPPASSTLDGATPVTASSDGLRNVTDGGSGHRDHDKASDKPDKA